MGLVNPKRVYVVFTSRHILPFGITWQCHSGGYVLGKCEDKQGRKHTFIRVWPLLKGRCGRELISGRPFKNLSESCHA